MAIASSCLSKVEERCSWIATSPESATLLYTRNTRKGHSVDVWPALPLIVRGDMTLSGTDNTMAALGQSNRVCQVYLALAGWQLEEVLAAMEVSFPELTELRLLPEFQSFPIRSWMDLRHVCESSNSMAFHFRDCQNCFCLLITLSNFGSLTFPIPGTFHPKRSSLSSPCCPVSEHFPLNSDLLNLALTWKPQVSLHQNALSSPLSKICSSKVLPNT
jgi:hypothetical protein